MLGIAQGGSATFSFALTGTGLGALTPQAFLSTLSVPPGAGEGVQAFVVRFAASRTTARTRSRTRAGMSRLSPSPEPCRCSVSASRRSPRAGALAATKS